MNYINFIDIFQKELSPLVAPFTSLSVPLYLPLSQTYCESKIQQYMYLIMQKKYNYIHITTLLVQNLSNVKEKYLLVHWKACD